MKSFFQEKLFCRIFHVLAMVMYVLLFAFCLGLTGENRSLDEHIILKKDFVVLNAFWICAALVCLFHVGKLSDRIQSRKGWNRLLGGVCALSALAGFLWVFASKTVPGADQLIVCRYADAFNSGEITMLDRKEYVVLYPYQLGVITVLRGVFSIFGPGDYQAFQPRCFRCWYSPAARLCGFSPVRTGGQNYTTCCLFFSVFPCMPTPALCMGI